MASSVGAAAAVNVPLFARVRVTAGTGTVKFVGQTSFAPGKWVGIELDAEGTGKNDGSVQGKAYFELDKAGTTSGVFVRPSQVHLLDSNGAASSGPSKDEDGFAVPAPPKIASRPTSSASSARAGLPTPSTPGAGAPTARRLSSRTGGVSSTAASSGTSSPSFGTPTRPNISSRSGVATSSSSSSAAAAATPSRPTSTRPVTGSRVSSSSSVASSSVGTPASVRRQSSVLVSAQDATPRRVSSERTAQASGPTSRSPLSATPRPSSSASSQHEDVSVPASSRTSALPRSDSRSMQRGISLSRTTSLASIAADDEGVKGQPTNGQRGPDTLTESSKQAQERIQARILERVRSRDAANSASGSDEHVSSEDSQQDKSHAGAGDIQPPAEKDRFSLRPAASSETPAETKAPSVPLRMFEELRMKYKLLEQGRQDDRERLKELERLKEDAESWVIARPKLQAKLVELANEVKSLRQQNKDYDAEAQTYNKKVEELHDQLEMETLDKEVAEEKIEALTAQLESSAERVAELEVELDVLRKEEARIVSEAGGGTEGEDEAKNSLAFIQLAKQNERLKEALIRLRDLTAENEEEHKRRVADLEKELDLTSDLQAAYDTTAEQLERAEQLVEDLKLQLDDAMGAEDMLEHLTERNLTLSERIEEMHAVIQDLEALKELNDELEENHVENEKQLQEEIDAKEYELRQYRTHLEIVQESILDYEGTITQFRELVMSLQSDIEQLRKQQETQQTESQALSSQSQAMLNLNMKLQTTVLKNRSKTIDFELRKFEAAQALKQLAIITPYLPPPYFEDDKSAVEALLFFERLSTKTHLLISAIDQSNGLSDNAFPEVVSDDLVQVCVARTKLARFMILAQRFGANLQRCDAATFVRMGKVYPELAGIEKRLDSFIDLSKRGELKELECASEVERFTAQAAHIAEQHLGESGRDIGEQHLGQLWSIDLDLDTFVAGIGYAKQAFAVLSKDPDVLVEVQEAELDDAIFTRLQSLIDSARAIKTLSKKLVRRADELSKSASSLPAQVGDTFQGASINMHSISVFANRFADLVGRYTSEVRSTKGTFQMPIFTTIVHEAASEIRSQSKDLLGVEVVLRNLQQTLSAASAAAMDPDNVISVTYEEPWTARGAEIRSNAAKDIDAERKVVKLTEDVRDLAREVRLKDQSIQESAVRIEVTEKRLESIKKQADTAAELEAELARVRKQGTENEATVAQLQRELDSLEAECAKLKQAVPSAKDADHFPEPGEFITYTGSLETTSLLEQIESLRGAVRYLRNQNALLKSRGLFKELNGLPSYETLMDTERQQRNRTVREESNALLQEVISVSTRSRIVDLSKIPPGGKTWLPTERRPSAQLEAKRLALESLKAKVESLTEEKRSVDGLTALGRPGGGRGTEATTPRYRQVVKI